MLTTFLVKNLLWIEAAIVVVWVHCQNSSNMMAIIYHAGCLNSISVQTCIKSSFYSSTNQIESSDEEQAALSTEQVINKNALKCLTSLRCPV